MLFLFALLCIAQAQIYHPTWYRSGWNYDTYTPTLERTYATPLVENTYRVQRDPLTAHNFGYSAPNHARVESGINGNVEGHYSFVDPNGKLIYRKYSANPVEGFNVEEKKYRPEVRHEIVRTPYYYRYPAWMMGETTHARSYKTFVEEKEDMMENEGVRKKRDTITHERRSYPVFNPVSVRNYESWQYPYVRNYAWQYPSLRYYNWQSPLVRSWNPTYRYETPFYYRYLPNYNYDYRFTTPEMTDMGMERSEMMEKSDMGMEKSDMEMEKSDMMEKSEDRVKRDAGFGYRFNLPMHQQFHHQTHKDGREDIYRTYEYPRVYRTYHQYPTMYRSYPWSYYY